jgi:hypothetical protein
VSTLAEERDVDVLILVESSIGTADALLTLNAWAKPQFHEPFNPTKRVQLFARLPPGSVRPKADNGYVSISHFSPPLGDDFLLAAGHLPSKLYLKPSDQAQFCTEIGRFVEAEENLVGHTRTILVGDLNMNPFEDGVVSAFGLHGVMSRGIAQRSTRTVLGSERRFMYNPMWRHFAATGAPTGTYFRSASGPIEYFWNVFDQVLVRPSLLDFFDDDSVEIVDHIGGATLLTPNHEPDEAVGSDHLPILFSLNPNLRTPS